MDEVNKLSTELHNSVFGDPWHGASVEEILTEINVEQAFHKPITSAHNIMELTLHLTAWTEEVLSRFESNPPALPKIGDWPIPADRTEEYWTELKQNFFQVTLKLIAAIKSFTEAELDKIVGTERNTAIGTGFSYSGLILGLVQHNAYHAGQISLIKKTFAQ